MVPPAQQFSLQGHLSHHRSFQVEHNKLFSPLEGRRVGICVSKSGRGPPATPAAWHLRKISHPFRAVVAQIQNPKRLDPVRPYSEPSRNEPAHLFENARLP